MKSNPAIFLLALFICRLGMADVCSDQSCPGGRIATSICITDPQTYRGNPVSRAMWWVSRNADCGYFTEKVIAHDTTDIMTALGKLARSCKSIDRMTINGHGHEGSARAGEIDAESIRGLSDYACLFNKDARIQFQGCNVGRGCQGDILLYQTAKTLLKNGGSVSGPTWYASSPVPGLVPRFSLNFNNRLLQYDPNHRPPDYWPKTGTIFGGGKNLQQNCIEDLDSKIIEAQKLTPTWSCGSAGGFTFVPESLQKSAQEMRQKMLKNSDFSREANEKDWHDLSYALEQYTRQTQYHGECALAEGSGGSSDTAK